MDPIFKKLNYKDQKVAYCLNAPASFEPQLAVLSDSTIVKREVGAGDQVEFLMAFVTKQDEIDRIMRMVGPLLQGDAVLWMCYPKGSSKRYKCDFNRDSGWAVMGDYGLEGVRQVAIDEDWSALRFRKVAYIKVLTRQFGALSEEGKQKSGQK